METVPEQAARLTSLILENRVRLAEINRQSEKIATLKAHTIAELNGALKALSGLVGGL
jgi:mRNA-degrading endonuclease toxin of MazEF toxin-antitoxin module